MTATSPENDTELAEKLLSILGSRYEFVSRLGAGAFGEVYRMRDLMLDRDVAIKRVRLDAFSDEAQRRELRERTIREARTAAKFHHPHIVTIFDVNMDLPDMGFILMEFIEGHTLGQLLKEKGRLTIEEAIRILSQTADALDFAHEKEVVHRDIKPANIMIEAAKGQVKVTDFGIAKSDASELTAAGSILGTPNYMSPEQARGDAQVDARSDLFSFGCVAYECLAGKKAFRGKNVMTTLMSIMNDAPAPIDYLALGLHPELSEVLTRALAKRPDERFQKAGELVKALTALPQSDASPTVAITTALPAPVQAPVVTRREPGNTSSFDIRLQGTLTEISVAEIIRDVYRSRNTGILHLKREGVGKRIYMKKGNVVFANSDVEDDRLGEFLIRQGKISREGFDAASEAMRRTGKRMGRTLVELDAVADEELDDLVRAQVNEIIFSVFEWDNGAYGFELLDRPVEEDIVVELSTAELVLEGVRRIRSLDSVRTALGATDRILRHTEDPLLLYQKMTLTPSEGFVLSRVDGATSVAEIAAISPLGEEETLRCVYALVAAGVVELVAKSAPLTSRMTSEQVPAAKPPRAEKKETPADAAKPGKEEPDAPTETEKLIIDDIAAKHASLETADLYGLLETTPGASDNELKKAYYAMAKKYHPDRHHLPHLREAHGLLEELFAKITDAYDRLSDPAERRRHDGARQQKKRAAKASAKSSGEKGAPTPGTDSVPPEVVAERQYQKALAHFDQMQYFDAIQCVRDSVRMMPADPRFRKLLARALSKNPKWRKEAETHFLEALKHDEFDIECLMGLAETYEAANLSTRAAKLYERILTYDPDNTVAADRLHGKSSKKGGPLSRLRRDH